MIFLQSGVMLTGGISFMSSGVGILGIGTTVSTFHIAGQDLLIKEWLYIKVKGIASSLVIISILCNTPRQLLVPNLETNILHNLHWTLFFLFCRRGRPKTEGIGAKPLIFPPP